MGATEQSSSDGSLLFGASLHHGEGSGTRSQARGTCGLGKDAKGVTRSDRRYREPKGKPHTRTSPGIEVECEGGGIDVRQEKGIS